ncbi:MAG: HAD family hydrolase [Sulfolobaceae archaeon]
MEEYNIFENVRGLFFDFDGTLVDFDTNSKVALNKVAEEIYNYIIENQNNEKKLKLDDVKNVVFEVAEKLDQDGVFERNYWWEEVMKKLGVKYERNQIYEFSSLYWSIASDNIPFDDAIELIRYLKRKNLKLGIITNSDGEVGNKRRRLERFPLISSFDVIIIAGEGGIRPKPYPEPFILGCEKLGLKINECAMIGDDPVKDCLAAKRVGMVSVLIDRYNKIKFAELYADLVIKNLVELEEFF